MKALLVLLATLTVLMVQSQTSVYHPFPESNAVWNVNMSRGMCFMGGFLFEDYSLAITGDTTINSQTYHKLTTPFIELYISGGCTQQNFPGYQGAFRQDIPNRKVFFVPPAQSTELLLYDFTMEAGDTIKGYLATFFSASDTVVGIDSVLIGDDYRKRWMINSCYDIYLIEGVGSTFGLLKPLPGCATDMDYYSLNCFSQDGQTLYPHPLTECQLITSTNQMDPNSDDVQVYPNPSNGSFTVGIGKPESISEIRLTDMLGKIILRRQIYNQNKLSIDDLPGGTYILTIVSKETRTTNRKIVSCR